MLRQSRITLVHLSLVLFAAAIVVRATQVQLFQSKQWARRAERQHFASATLPAPRGAIYDVSGAPLAMSREMLRLSISPRELKDRRTAWRDLTQLGVPSPFVARATDARRAWVDIPGTYSPARAAPLASMRGVYTRPTVDRVYTPREATRRIVGWVDDTGTARAGLEMALDSLLRGTDGHAVIARDARGRRFDSPADSDVLPEAGDEVQLTINQELQEISVRALSDAITKMGATGGDIVILDPEDGEIRAMASDRVGQPTFGNPALSEPFEPGSTLKPLFAAALMQRGLARPTDTVNTENGAYTIEGRTIHDEHPASRLSLAQVIEYSSNIGIVKFVSRLTQRQEFETLRDYGFGMPTGVPYPGEAGGTLYYPAEWSKQSPASMAIGYEVAVTPLQLAAAYGAVANGGDLLQPALIKAIRSRDGTVLYQHDRRVVRHLMSSAVAAKVRQMMIGVVEGGTSKEAQLARFTLAGKSGTARRGASKHGYKSGDYTASFVGLFPADKPLYVIIVKLDNPKATIFGGTAAAPVSKIVLQAAIASRDAALDRSSLATSESLSKVDDTTVVSTGDVAHADAA
ncbi:MAG TPA: penicillin-binding protein 2, partial [Gemmatimonadaceae bacterium]|nr:penicillin-binding protein 2 [Gemmatimonadaceae bacterium]